MKSNLITVNQLQTYNKQVKKCAVKIGISVLLCIMSPAILIVLSGISEGTGAVSESVTYVSGICCMVVMVVAAIVIFITGIIQFNRNNDDMCQNSDVYSLEQAAVKYLSDLKLKHKKAFSSGVLKGIIVCIIAAIPVIVAGMFFENIALYECIAAAFFLVVFAIEAAYFIYCQIKWSGYNRL